MQLVMSAKIEGQGTLSAGLRQRVLQFSTDVRNARTRAAVETTRASQAHVRRIRELAAPRRNRYHGLARAITWRSEGDAGVELDIKKLNDKFPPWLVQEIGTGESAVLREGGVANPVGRPKKGATYVKTVRSQRGRKITPGLVFATRGGRYSPPGAARGQQLHLRSRVQGAPARRVGNRSAPGIVISREIEGQHFIRDGATEGFRQYRESVLAAARSQFRRRR